MNDIRAMFLRQSMLDCEKAFQEAVTLRDVPAWDWLVVTAANDAQAEAYRIQIEQRLQAGRLPRQTKYAVIPDPDGKRVGSGGATLHVMREIARARGEDAGFASQRILVLHSGGDSQRVPQYSACGKLFSRVPRALPDGGASTLFDEFCISLSCIPQRIMNGGMLLMSGDVLLLFNALQIDLERVGAACFSMKAPVDVGTRHGVFLSDGNGGVRQFLHKQDENALRAAGAVNAQNQVDIDTGAVWLDASRVDALYSLVRDDEGARQLINEEVRLSLYGDFVYPMAAGSSLEQYLAQTPENEHSKALEACRRTLWDALGGSGLSLIRLAPAEFIHFGTTDEWRELLISGEERFGFLGWKRMIASVGPAGSYAAINSLIAPSARIGEGCAIEDCRIGENAVIGARCVISGAAFDGTLEPDTALHVLPVEDGNGYCARVYGVRDNPKEAKWFGSPIAEPLWRAKLHPVLPDAPEAARYAVEKRDATHKMGLCDGFAAASMKHVLSWQKKLAEDIRAQQVIRALQEDVPATEAVALLSSGEQNQEEALLSLAEEAAFPLKHRLYHVLARAAEARHEPSVAEERENACWRAINEHMVAAAKREMPTAQPRIVQEHAKVTLPVRVNWGGGWSDTPPYCLEHGGSVLNAAMLLHGRRPVEAVARRIAEPVIRIESDDLGVHREYRRMEELATGNPQDPHALCKAALAICGVVPDGGQGPLAPLLAQIGGGILLRTFVHGVPKGSGLGTSSILCAAVVRALSRVLGQPDDDARVAWLTLCMEQLMNTGGGWQDQVGGLLPGIKLISSHPGTPQRLAWRNIAVPDDAMHALARRHALVFTGQRRMARNILRDIMGKAVANHPETMRVLADIQRLAVLMAFELEMGRIDQFAKLLREHWALSKRLDAGSSNTCIDHMITVCDDLVDGVMICGAGGGGFMSMLMKEGVTTERLSDRFALVYQESGVQVYDAAFDMA